MKLELSILETNLQRLSGADFRALIAMSKYVDNTGRCFPSVPRIADDIGVKRRMVQRSMRRLEEVGLIKTEMVGGGRYRPNKYRLLHFTFGKNENSDKSDAVMGEKGDSLDAVTEQRNSDKNRQKGDKIGRNSDNLVPETASNLSPEQEPLTRASNQNQSNQNQGKSIPPKMKIRKFLQDVLKKEPEELDNSALLNTSAFLKKYGLELTPADIATIREMKDARQHGQ